MKFTQEMLAGQMQTLSGSAIREIFHLLSKPGMISFAGGNPAASALEPDVIAELGQKALEKHGWMLLQYGATEGFTPLRESIAEYVRRAGVETTQPEKVFPTQGSQQAMDLLCQGAAQSGRRGAGGVPHVPGRAANAAHLQGGLARPRNRRGRRDRGRGGGGDPAIPPEADVRDPHLPKPHRPHARARAPRKTGGPRLEVRRGAGGGRPLPGGALPARRCPRSSPSTKRAGWSTWAAFQRPSRRAFASGTRWWTTRSLLQKMVIGKQATDVHSPLINQAIVDGYLRSGRMDEHLKRICADYKARLDVMLNGLDKLSAFGHPHGAGGRPVRLGCIAGGRGRAGHADKSGGKKRCLRARHPLLLRRRPPEHHAPELLEREVYRRGGGHGAPDPGDPGND